MTVALRSISTLQYCYIYSSKECEYFFHHCSCARSPCTDVEIFTSVTDETDNAVWNGVNVMHVDKSFGERRIMNAKTSLSYSMPNPTETLGRRLYVLPKKIIKLEAVLLRAQVSARCGIVIVGLHCLLLWWPLSV